MIYTAAIPFLRRLAKPLPWIFLAGVALYWFTTTTGIGVGYDSFIYLSAAENLLSGKGLVWSLGPGSGEPLTHYPPLYPFSLATAGLMTRLELVDAARAMTALLYGLNLVFVSSFIGRFTQSSIPVILSGLSLLASPIFMEVHLMAMSEPLFITVWLSSYLFLFRFIEHEKNLDFILSAVLCGMGILSRYAGAAFAPAFAIILVLFSKKSLGDRLWRGSLFIALSLAPILLWYTRNYLAAGTATNRILQFHPAYQEQLQIGYARMLYWIFPERLSFPVALVPGIFLMAFTLFGAYLALWFWWDRKRVPIVERKPLVFVGASLISIVAYASLLLFSLTFFDASTRLADRILSPIYLLGTMVLFVTLWRIWRYSRSQALQLVLASVYGCFLLTQTVQAGAQVISMKTQGLGFTSTEWTTSETIDFIGQLPEETVVYSNEAFAIAFLTGVRPNAIPERIDPVTKQPHLDIDAKLDQMRRQIAAENGFLIIFDTLHSTADAYPPIEDLTTGLSLVRKLSDGAVYVSPADPQE